MEVHGVLARNWLFGVILVFAAGVASAQSAQQLVKEAWVATKTDLLELGTQSSDLGLAPRLGGGSNFVALAFEPPPAPGQTRHLIGADGSNIVFLREGDPSATVVSTINLANEAPGFTTITALAITDHATLLVSGYSKRRRWYELWEAQIVGASLTGFQQRATDHPQLTDAVYVPAEDIAPGSTLVAGLVAAAGRQVLSFSTVSSYSNVQTLVDVRNLPLPNNSSLLSVDLVRQTNALVVATSTRKLLVTSPLGQSPVLFNIPDVWSRNCAQIKTQRLKLRVARGGTNDAVFYLADGCGQALRYDFDNPYTDLGAHDFATAQQFSGGLVALAVGEGNSIVCKPDEACELVTGFNLFLEEEAELFYTEYALCDPRITGATCAGDPDAVVASDFVLSLNSLLPPNAVALLGGADVTLPGDMYSWSADGSFKAFIINTATPWEQGVAEAILTAGPLVGSILHVDEGLPSGTSVQRLLNQAQVGFAPDGDEPPSVGHSSDCASGPCFASTPVVTGAGSARTTLRSNSVITVGVMLDQRPATGSYPTALVPARLPAGGIPASQNLSGGTPPLCGLEYNGTTFAPVANWKYYFVDMAACLFGDLERVLKAGFIPDSVFGGTANRNALINRLGNAEDKVIKGLNSAGSSQGAQNLGAVFSQMANFDALVAATPVDAFDPERSQIYINELRARSEAFQFNLRHRTIPSIPTNGIVLP
jgi:hypothetical protein